YRELKRVGYGRRGDLDGPQKRRAKDRGRVRWEDRIARQFEPDVGAVGVVEERRIWKFEVFSSRVWIDREGRRRSAGRPNVIACDCESSGGRETTSHGLEEMD